MNYAGIHATAVGADALKACTTGGDNTAVGRDALVLITTGYDNTAIGANAGGNSTGYNNVFIGYNAVAPAAGNNNLFVMGNSSTDNLRCNTQTINSLSDERDKTDIVDLPIGLDFVNKLRPVKFKWQHREENIKNGRIDTGFIAQELQVVQNESDANYVQSVDEANPDKLAAAYGKLIPVMVQAIKELSAEVEQLKSQLNN